MEWNGKDKRTEGRIRDNGEGRQEWKGQGERERQ
jgi:hypothetical protein